MQYMCVFAKELLRVDSPSVLARSSTDSFCSARSDSTDVSREWFAFFCRLKCLRLPLNLKSQAADLINLSHDEKCSIKRVKGHWFCRAVAAKITPTFLISGSLSERTSGTSGSISQLVWGCIRKSGPFSQCLSLRKVSSLILLDALSAGLCAVFMWQHWDLGVRSRIVDTLLAT